MGSHEMSCMNMNTPSTSPVQAIGRVLPAAFLLLGGLGQLAQPVAAQTYPDRPISLVVGFPPGGGADGPARLISEALGRELKQPVVHDSSVLPLAQTGKVMMIAVTSKEHSRSSPPMPWSWGSDRPD